MLCGIINFLTVSSLPISKIYILIAGADGFLPLEDTILLCEAYYGCCTSEQVWGEWRCPETKLISSWGTFNTSAALYTTMGAVLTTLNPSPSAVGTKSVASMHKCMWVIIKKKLRENAAVVRRERTTMKGEKWEGWGVQYSLDVEWVTRWELSVLRVGPI